MIVTGANMMDKIVSMDEDCCYVTNVNKNI
jgi:hypothetical protein